MHGISDITKQSSHAPITTVSIVPFMLIIIGLVTLLSYSPILFNFFAGDDFVHLNWLSQAIHQPDLILRNFYTSWLDGTTTRFYRPLISVFMASDYLIWGTNGLGFHLTNICFHLSSSLLIYLIVRHLQRTFLESSTASLVWALSASAIFALYPLHPEAVSWITGRVDSVVTTFCLASIWCYIKWQEQRKNIWFYSALFSNILALLSKEMSVTLPLIFFAYQLCYLPIKPLPKKNILAKSLAQALIPTLPFWGLLAIYFIVRYLALGTFVGGYDNSLFFIANPKEFLLTWLHAIKMFLIPINKNLLGSHNLLVKAWEFCLISIGVLFVLQLLQNKASRKIILFIFFWLVFSLIPVYKIFAVTDDLQGSRLAYLASVPLCILLAFAFTNTDSSPKIQRIFQRVLLPIFIVLCSLLLWINNQPWAKAGYESNTLRQALQRLYDQLSGDPQTLLVGLPDQIDGAYTCRNALDGMLKRPQFKSNIKNCLMVNPFEPIFPFGYLKESIAQNKESIHIFYWDSMAKKFTQVFLPPDSNVNNTKIWTGAQLKKIVTALANQPQQYAWQEDGSLTIRTESQPLTLEFNLGTHPCWSTDFITIAIQLSPRSQQQTAGLDLLYTNDLNNNFELKNRCHAVLKPENPQLVFSLRGLPAWSLGSNFKRLKLLIPPHLSLTIKSLALADKALLMPSINFENSGYLGSKGYLHLSPAIPKGFLDIDCHNIPEATNFELEISRTNLLFEQQNPQIQSMVAMKKIFSTKVKSRVELNLGDFPQAGIYELRAWAKSRQGKLLAVGSDHIVISVDSQ